MIFDRWTSENMYASLAVCSVVAGATGYFLGSRFSEPRVVFIDEAEEEEDDDYVELKPTGEECKMMLVVRTDLKMGKGKAAAQCSHAAVASYKRALRQAPQVVQQWERQGQMKVTLQCPSEEEMELLHAMAMSLSIPAYVIHDAGRTQIAAGSATVLGLGPAPKSVLDQVTGELKLY